MEEKGGDVKWKMAVCQVAKSPFSCLLVLYTLLHHKHLITEDRLQCMRVCARVPAITCSSDHKNVKGFVSQSDIRKQLFRSADRIGDTEMCNLEPCFLSESHKER